MSSRIYFQGLNELRALAALAVLFHHIELYKYKLNLPSLYDFPVISTFIANIGSNGVDLFFVISGFLITFLLLKEQGNTGSISIKKFYIRRILRIWPIYFLIIFLSFGIIPFIYFKFSNFFEGQFYFNQLIEWIDYKVNFVFFIFFLSNISLSIYGPVVGASQSWSVSVEEQFYIIWPLVVRLFHKILIPFLIALIVFKIGLNWMIQNQYIELNNWMLAFVSTFRVEFLATGALLAKVYKFNNKLFKIILRNNMVFLFVCSAIIIQLYFQVNNFTIALNFGLLILCFIERETKIKALEYLGKISYGIYMFHPIIMYFSFSLIYQLGYKEIITLNLLAYPIIIVLTIIVSSLSYAYFESYFLRFKENYSPIKSGKI